MRFADRADVFDDMAEAVLDHAPAAGAADQGFLLGQLHAFLARILDISEADQVRHDFALRVETLVFLARVDAVDIQFGDFVGHFDVHLALQVDEAAVGIELAAQIALAHVEQRGQGADFFPRRQQHVVRNRPDRLDGD